MAERRDFHHELNSRSQWAQGHPQAGGNSHSFTPDRYVLSLLFVFIRLLPLVCLVQKVLDRLHHLFWLSLFWPACILYLPTSTIFPTIYPSLYPPHSFPGSDVQCLLESLAPLPDELQSQPRPPVPLSRLPLLLGPPQRENERRLLSPNQVLHSSKTNHRLGLRVHHVDLRDRKLQLLRTTLPSSPHRNERLGESLQSQPQTRSCRTVDHLPSTMMILLKPHRRGLQVEATRRLYKTSPPRPRLHLLEDRRKNRPRKIPMSI